jgi:hypothetical protein
LGLEIVYMRWIPFLSTASPEKASPLSGTWEGTSDAFDRMEVSV